MRLKNVLLVVKDIEVSKSFYKDLFGLQVLTDFGSKAIMSEGLVLQAQKEWEKATLKEVSFGSHSSELYFEEYDLDAFAKRLEISKYPISYATPLKDCQGEKLVRLYDPDLHLIEVKECVSSTFTE